jgi:hypothetical protein
MDCPEGSGHLRGSLVVICPELSGKLGADQGVVMVIAVMAAGRVGRGSAWWRG